MKTTTRTLPAPYAVEPAQTASRLCTLKGLLGEAFLFSKHLKLPEMLAYNERLLVVKNATDFERSECESEINALMAEVNAVVALRINPATPTMAVA